MKVHKHVKKHLHKYFVPHKHNDYHPHLFRTASVTFILGLAIFLLGISFGNSIFLSKTVLGVNIATNVLVDMANESRVSLGVKQLVKNEKLEQAAAMKADDMIQKQYFAHYAPDGTTPWYFISEAGYNFEYAGENLAINFNESKQVNDAWMNSQFHKDNLLNTNFEEIGLAAKEGVYNGVNTVYVVQMFGTEKKADAKTFLTDKFETTNLAHNEVRSNDPNDQVKIIQKGENTIVAQKVEKKDLQIFKTENTTSTSATTSVVLGTENGNNEMWGEVLGVSQNNLPEATEMRGQVLDKDGNVVTEAQNKYAGAWENFVFNSSYYIEIFLIVLCVLVLLGIVIRMFVEFERQHYRHFLYALLLLFILLSLALFNYHLIPFLG